MKPDDLVCHVSEPGEIDQRYSKFGAVVVRGAIEPDLLDEMRATLLELIRARLQAAGRALNAAELDAAYAELKCADAGFARELIVASRETLGFYRIITSRMLGATLSRLLPHRAPQIVHDCCMMRIDGRDDGRNFDWHYDYAYNAMSQDAVTCWIPITPVTHDMGNLRLIPGSHTTVRPVRLIKDLAGVAFAGPRKIALASPDIYAFEREAVELPDVAPGDSVFLHALTLHCSGENTTDRARWIVNPRFSDLMDHAVVSRGWKVSRAKDPFVFAEIRPDKVSA